MKDAEYWRTWYATQAVGELVSSASITQVAVDYRTTRREIAKLAVIGARRARKLAARQFLYAALVALESPLTGETC